MRAGSAIILLLLLCQLLGTGAQARPHWDCSHLLARDIAAWSADRHRLHHELKNSADVFRKAMIHDGRVWRGEVLGRGASGVVYSGLFDGREVAVKEYAYNYFHESERPSIYKEIGRIIAIHRALAEHGIAPEFHAVYVRDSYVGLVMERLESRTNFAFRDEMFFLRRLFDWEHRMRRKLQWEQFGKVLRLLHILPHDLQCLVGSDATLHLHDFDAYGFYPEFGPKQEQALEAIMRGLAKDLHLEDI